MSTPHTPTEVLSRHRKLTKDIRTRVPEPMHDDLQKIAARNGWSLSEGFREAVAEFITNHKARRSPVKPAR